MPKGEMRMANKTEQIVEQLAAPIAESLGLFVYDVEFKKEGPDYYLRVFIDKEEGTISVDECEAVSRPLSDALDEADPISESYYLEVSSPGIERKLKKQHDFDRFREHLINIKFFAPFNGEKNLVGVLKERDENLITVETENGDSVEIDNKLIAEVKLYVEF